MISFEPFWKTLKSKNISTYTLIEQYKVSSSTLSRLRNNKGINTTTLNDLCEILNCRVEDILQYVPKENKWLSYQGIDDDYIHLLPFNSVSNM